jgi:nitroimidazol reductase NimA-like FMN-containing flavoprotein (pyridoxamine 5'-phosphate oxidase superfamily)
MKATDSLVTRVYNIFKKAKYINIATVTKDSQPWNTPVHAVYDETYNLFWSSWGSAQHSKNIRENNRIFITIYGSSRQADNGRQECVYIKARAKQLDDEDEIAHALHYFYGLGDRKHLPADFMDGGVKRLYQAVPEKVWLNEVSDTQINETATTERAEVPLTALKQRNPLGSQSS